MHNERIITELQKAYGLFFEVNKIAEREASGVAQTVDDGAKAGMMLAQGLMAMTEAMIQSELRAQEYMRQMQAAQQQGGK